MVDFIRLVGADVDGNDHGIMAMDGVETARQHNTGTI